MIDPAVVGLVSAMTALVASIVGPFTTLHIGRSQIRAAVLSTNRQKWIDGFRDLISTFCGHVSMVAQLQESIVKDGRLSIAHDPDLLKQFERLVVTFTKIKLMMNPDDEDHGTLLVTMRTVLLDVRSPDATPEIATRIEACVGEIAAMTQIILRREWVRVKHLT
jgi:hypothetical protein